MESSYPKPLTPTTDSNDAQQQISCRRFTQKRIRDGSELCLHTAQTMEAATYT